MKLIAPFIAFAIFAIAPAQKLSVTVNAADGTVVSGEQHFIVKVQAKNPVTQVEFYVGTELRDTDASTPYEFTLDTLGEPDGDLKLKFTAYTREGENVAKTISVKVDNGISKGAAFHLTHAKEALSLSKWDDAITAGRIALKADPKSTEARLDLARAYMGKKVWDKAQKFAEDASAADPNNLEGLELIGAINLNRAFNTVNRSGERSETTSIIATALKSAVTARRKSLDRQIDTFGDVNDANRLAYVDLVMRGGRYSLAIAQLAPSFKHDPKNNDVADRLIYAYMRAGRMQDAREALDNVRRYGAFDAYGNALDAVYQSESGNDQKASDAVREAILSDPDSLGVKSAQAFIALKRNDNRVLGQLARDLAATDSQRTEVNYYIASLYNRVQDPNSKKFFERAVLIEPTNYDMYIEWANYSFGLGVNGKLEKKDADAEVAYAAALYNAASIANPSSAQALTGLSLVSLYQGKIDAAVSFGLAATQAAPQYAATHYAYAAAANAKASSIKVLGSGDAQQQARLKTIQDEMTKTAKDQNDLSGRLDEMALQGREIPKVLQAWQYFAGAGRTVVMVPPGRG